MRLKGQAKLGYYPTPEAQLPLIASCLRAEGTPRLLDPCCGQGEALACIAQVGGGAETYGIELSPQRAEAAAQVLTRVINTGYEYAVLTDETFSGCLVNPPYDGQDVTGGGTRLEETFLLATTPRLMPGGVLIYIVPHARLSEKIARHLAGWYGDLRCFKLAGDDYQVFKQVVIFGTRLGQYAAPTDGAVNTVLAWVTAQRITGHTEATEQNVGGKKVKVRRPQFADLPELGGGAGEYCLLPAPAKGKDSRPFRFQYTPVTDEGFLRAADEAAAQLEAKPDWMDLIPPTEPPVITPAMTPKQGHVAMQVSGGVLGTNLVRDETGMPLLIKGNVGKYAVGNASGGDDDLGDGADDDERSRMWKVEIEERFQTTLTTLTEQGELTRHDEPAAIAEALRQHVVELAERIQARNTPLYDFNPQDWETDVLRPLSLARRLPGRAETGLTPFQKHLVVALGRMLQRYGAGFINAEMGSGKTTIGISVAEYLHTAARRNRHSDGYPALVVCPSILTNDDNWPREIREVTPGARGFPVDRTARPVPKPMKIGPWLVQQGIELEERLFEGLSASKAFTLVQRAANDQDVAISERVLAALWASLAQAEKHPPMRRRGAKSPNLLDGRIGGFAWLGLGDLARDEGHVSELRRGYSLAQFIADYRAGTLPEKSFAIVSYETAKLGPGRVPAVGTRWMDIISTDEDDNTITATEQVLACPTCGSIVAEEYDEDGRPVPEKVVLASHSEQWLGLRRRFCQAPHKIYDRQRGKYVPGKWVWDGEQGRKVIASLDQEGQPFVCGAPLFEYTALRREAAAAYVNKHARNFFRLLIVDEVHKAKAKGTGVGHALTALGNAIPRTLGMTGTLFGGHSTSIFWLLFRLAAEVRQEFDFNDERRWAEKFGLLKTTFYAKQDPGNLEEGAFTGRRHFETVEEKPGISPAIARFALKYCAFSSLKDIGLPLPEYREHIVRLEMTEAMREQYEQLDGSQSSPPSGLLAWALEEKKKKDGKGALSVWLNTALNRPDAMFRDEDIYFNRRVSGRGRFAVRRQELVEHAGSVIAPGEWLPKEKWLVDTCRTERAAGRKVLVYVRQTGGRDIQPRLMEALSAAGLRASVLRRATDPRKRMDWIKRHADRLDVLIANARLVEVGLNLVMFPTAIFFEAEWSLYVLWQAMRRVYRPGAPLPVELHFPVYTGTMEEYLLDLIGQKMKAAQTFYGDEIGGALIESDDGDLLTDLIRQRLAGTRLRRANGLFGNEGDHATNPGDATMAASAFTRPHLDWGELVKQRREIVNQRLTRRNGNSRPHGQAALLL